jgi:hypothetical protein
MPAGSLGLSLARTTEGRVVTGPMALAFLTVLGAVAVRLTGLDHAGVAFCYFKALTGYACFTCGATRAFGHLARFDLPSAFAVQPLITLGALGILAWGAVDAALLPSSRRTRVLVEGRSLRILIAVAVALAILNWVYLLATGV